MVEHTLELLQYLAGSPIFIDEDNICQWSSRVGTDTHMSDLTHFVPNAPFLYLLKTSENQFSGARERVHWEQNGLNQTYGYEPHS